MINLYKAMPLLVLLVVWELMVSIDPTKEFFIGSPSGMAQAFVSMHAEHNLLYHTGITMFEAVAGFLLGTILGSLFGVSLWSSHLLHQIARPYLIVLGAIPVFALGPVLIFWFGTGILSKLVLGFLITFAVAATQAYEGGSQADEKLIVLARVYGADKKTIYRQIVFPCSLVWVLSGVRINISMALMAAFIGEFISSSAGIGYLIILSEGLYDVNAILVGIMIIALMALFFNKLVEPLEMKAKSWK